MQQIPSSRRKSDVQPYQPIEWNYEDKSDQKLEIEEEPFKELSKSIASRNQARETVQTDRDQTSQYETRYSIQQQFPDDSLVLDYH